MKRHIVFILNPISGTARKDGLPDLIASALDTSRFDYEIVFTERAGHATELAAWARDAGVDVVVAVGGDGTVNEVARALVYSDTALGIIPCGSGNGLARHLLLPINPRQAVEMLNACEIHALDYGRVNEHYFFCTCGMGFDALVSQKFAEGGKRGPLTYAESIVKEGFKYRAERYEIDDNMGLRSQRALLISCANASQYGNNAYIAPQASMSDGLMDVVIIRPLDLIETPQFGIDMFNKTLDLNPNIVSYRSKHVRIRRAGPGYIHYDGEPVMAGAEVDIRLESKGIRIVVNPHGDTASRRPNPFQTALAELYNRAYMLRHGKR